MLKGGAQSARKECRFRRPSFREVERWLRGCVEEVRGPSTGNQRDALKIVIDSPTSVLFYCELDVLGDEADDPVRHACPLFDRQRQVQIAQKLFVERLFTRHIFAEALLQLPERRGVLAVRRAPLRVLPRDASAPRFALPLPK